MTKEEILNYVMDTPNNTNRMVLGDMIDELVNSSSSGGGGLVVTWDGGSDYLDKTWQEIHDVMVSGGLVIINRDSSYYNTNESYVCIGCAKYFHWDQPDEYQYQVVVLAWGGGDFNKEAFYSSTADGVLSRIGD